eukprot:PhM_4_TR17385/c2_g1_i2/m.32832
MGFLELGQMLLTHLQFLSLMNHLDIEWPDSWRQILSWVEVFNLDFNDIMIEHDLPRFDFRAIFVLIAVILPILIILLVLVIFNPIYVVMWYAVLVCGVMLLGVGALGYWLPSATDIGGEQDIAMTYLVLGAILVGLAGIMYALRKCKTKASSNRRRESDVEAIKKEALEFNWFRSLKHFLLSAICFVAGAILFGVIDINVGGFGSGDLGASTVLQAIALVSMVFGVVVFIYFITNLFALGRKITYKVGVFLNKNLLKLLLVVISISFIPIVSYCVNMFMCVEYTCPAGTKFNPFVHRPVGNVTRDEAHMCDPCVFEATTCGISAPVETLCPSFSDRRLVKYPDISCSDSAYPYFVVAGVFSILVYCFGVPVLFYRTVMMCTATVASKIQVVEIPGEGALTGDEKYLAQLYTSDAAPSSLYRPYKHVARYFSLVQLFHKTAVVVMLILVSPFRSDVAIVLTLIIHAIGTMILFRHSPYIAPIEGWVAGSLAVASVLNSVYGIIVWKEGDSVPGYTTAIFIVLNGVLPVFALVIVQIFVNRRLSSNQRERRQKIRDEAVKSKKRLRKAKKNKKKLEEEMNKRNSAPVGGVEDGANKSDDEEEDDPEVSHAPYGSDNDQNNAPAAVVDIDELGQSARDAELLRREVKRIDEENAEVDDALNRKVARIMTRQFMLMGLLLFFGLGLSILGSLRTPVDEFVNASYGEKEKELIFAGFDNWDTFTSHCCCMPHTKEMQDFAVVERWACLKNGVNATDVGRTVTRGRVSDDFDDNGLNIRGLCQVMFSSNCTIDPAGASVFCSPIPQNTSSKALDNLW